MPAEHDQHIITKSYQGPTEQRYHNRPLDQCQREWREHGLDTTFDQLVCEQITAVVERGESQVVIADIGCGDGGLIHDAITNHRTLPQARALLSNHPDVSIHFLGITDAQNTNQFGKERCIQSPTQERMSASIIPYTLTARQTLDQLCEEFNIPNIHLALATWSLPYLGPKTFSYTIEDIINRLATNGQCVALGWSDLIPGMPKTDYGLSFYTGYRPNLPQKSNREAGKHTMLVEKSLRFQTSTSDQLKQERNALVDSLDVLLAKDGIELRDIAQELQIVSPADKPDITLHGTKIRKNYRSIVDALIDPVPGEKDTYTQERWKREMSRIADHFITEGTTTIYQRKRKEIRQKKREVLARLQFEYSEIADITFDDHSPLIRIKKR